jgi:hypothetical protein
MFMISRSGTVVTFQGADNTILKIPAGQAVQTIEFTGGVSLGLRIDDNQVKLGDQVITTIPSPIDYAKSYNL